MLHLDHLAVAGETLDEAARHIEEALGVAMLPGGRHEHFGTHNRVLSLADGLYLEAIAIDPDAVAPMSPRWFDLDRFSGTPRLSNWICRTDDLGSAPQGAGKEVPLSRGDMRWSMLVPDDGILPFDNLLPAVIQWKTAPTPAESLPPSGLTMRKLLITHPQADLLQNELNITDDRIEFAIGPNPQLAAVIETPDGERVLS